MSVSRPLADTLLPLRALRLASRIPLPASSWPGLAAAHPCPGVLARLSAATASFASGLQAELIVCSEDHVMATEKRLLGVRYACPLLDLTLTCLCCVGSLACAGMAAPCPGEGTNALPWVVPPFVAGRPLAMALLVAAAAGGAIHAR